MTRHFLLAVLLSAPMLSGCTTDAVHRYDGVSFGAGNAMAANTVLQMVDPWPAGVEQTQLSVPADLEQYRKAQPSKGDDGRSITSDKTAGSR